MWQTILAFYENIAKRNFDYRKQAIIFVFPLNSDPKVKVKMVGKYGPLIGAIDQGTSSSRFLVNIKQEEDINSNPCS